MRGGHGTMQPAERAGMHWGPLNQLIGSSGVGGGGEGGEGGHHGMRMLRRVRRSLQRYWALGDELLMTDHPKE